MIDLERLAGGWTTRACPARASRSSSRIHLRRLAERDLRDPPRRAPRRAPDPAADRAGEPRRRDLAGVAHHRGARRHRGAAHAGDRARARTRRARPRLLPDGLRRRLVADGARHGADGTAWPAPFDTDLEARKGLAYQLVEGIALLGKVDWQAKGLQDLGRPDGFHERQVDRWTTFLERIKGRELPGFDEAAAWLRAHRPIDFVPGLMHGDYQFANVMYRARRAGAAGRHRRLGDGHGRRPEARPRLGRAELARGHDSGDGTSGGYVDMYGMPSRSEVLAHYAEVSGRQVDDIDYYMRAGQVEARGRARAGLPAGRRRRRSSRRSARSCST